MVNASLTYEILLYLNFFYFGLYAAVELGMGVLKAVNLPYPDNTLAKEGGLLVALCIIESIRIVLGRRGSLSERSLPVYLSTLLTVPSAMLVVFLLAFQTHPLKLERILCGLMLCLQATELFFAFLFVITICRPVSYD